MLTKKDFKKVAEILKKNRNKAYGYLYFENTLNDFVEYLKTTNEKFDERKFREAVLKE